VLPLVRTLAAVVVQETKSGQALEFVMLTVTTLYDPCSTVPKLTEEGVTVKLGNPMTSRGLYARYVTELLMRSFLFAVASIVTVLGPPFV
jgi:hypothetical protein